MRRSEEELREMEDKDFNQLGGVQLDKASRSVDRSPAQPCPTLPTVIWLYTGSCSQDVRILVKEFSDKSEAVSLRDHFARLTQMALLLNLDR